MADKAYITPKVLKWARESAKITLEVAASKVSIKADRLNEWEEGSSQPTIRQAETLAKAYRRPFSLFFLPDIPNDFMPLNDFRRSSSKELSTGSVFIIREVQQKQAWISEINEENNETPLAFVGKFSLKSHPQEVAEDILNTLHINPKTYSKNPIRDWIESAEKEGIFVSRTSYIHSRMTLDSDEFRGFAIADKFAPFIFINSDDWNSSQLFTIAHELAHIWIAASGISNEVDLLPTLKSEIHPVELFCNEVAGNALMPSFIMEELNQRTFHSAKIVFNEARRLGVSSFAFLVRSLKMNLISLDTYKALKADADAEYEAFLVKEQEKAIKQKQRPGGPDPYLTRLNKNSRLFTQIVLDAFRGGRILPTDASNLLNTQVNKFHKLEHFLYS